MKKIITALIIILLASLSFAFLMARRLEKPVSPIAQNYENISQKKEVSANKKKTLTCSNREKTNGVCPINISCSNIVCQPDGQCVNGRCTSKRDVISILDSYASLSQIKQKLLSLSIKNKRTNTNTNGYELLKILSTTYNPQDDNKTKEIFLNNFFQDYDFGNSEAKLFILNITHGLWTEAYGNLPWSLKNATTDEINQLFIQNDSIGSSNSDITGRPPIPAMPHTELQLYPNFLSTISYDAHFKQYNLALKLVNGAKTQKEAVENVALWAEKNFFFMQLMNPEIVGHGKYIKTEDHLMGSLLHMEIHFL